MATPKQKENEEKYLNSLLRDLKPEYSDITEDVVRGKQRGEGIMVDPDAHEEREEALREASDAAKDAKRTFSEEARAAIFEKHGVYEENQFGSAEWLHNLEEDGKISEKKRKEMSEEVRQWKENHEGRLQELKQKELRELPYSQDDLHEMAKRWYVAEYMKYLDRNSWVPAKLTFGTGGKFLTKEEKNMLEALGGVLYTVQHKKDPEWRPTGEASEPSQLQKMYGGSKEKSQERLDRKKDLFR